MKQSPITTWTARFFGIRPEEGRRTVLAAVFYFFFVCHVVMVKSASNALFLSRHDPKHLPLLYILVALAVGVIVLLASRVLADPRRYRMRLLSLAGTALVLLATWAGLRFARAPVSPFLYLFGEAAATALNIQFWSVAGDIFNAQEGKRVFGILAGGGMTGSIFGGIMVHYLSPVIGAENLLLTAVGALGLCLTATAALARHGGQTGVGPRPGTPSLRQAFGYVVGETYPRAFALLMMLSAVLTVVVDFFFRASARSFLQEDQLAVLFGDLNSYVGAISVAFLFLLSGRVLRFFGIFNYLLIVPAGMLLSCLAAMLTPAFLAVFALKIIENSGSLSINQAGLQLLYNPVPNLLRSPARGVIDGFFRKLGYAVGGGLLLLLGARLDRMLLPALIAGMLVLFALLLFFLRRHYLRALDKKIRVGSSGPTELRLDDGATREVLLASLSAPEEDAVVTALSLLGPLPSLDIRPQLGRLLSHPSERVRLLAIDTLGRRGYQDFLLDLLSVANQGTRRCRVAAIRAIMNIDPLRAGGALAPYLRSADPGLVAAAIEALVLNHGYEAGNPAVAVLEERLARGPQASPAERREMARLLGRLGESPYAERIADYLSDPEPSVRRLAAQSAARVYREAFVPRLLDLLTDRETRADARAALAGYGDRIVEELERWLNDRERPLSVRLRIPRLLRMIATVRAGQALLFSNIQDDAHLRYRIALALSGIRLQHPEIEFDRRWTLQAIDRRLESYRYYAPLYDRLARVLPPGFLVIRVLRDRLEQNLEVVFRLLGLIYPYRTIMSIYLRLRGRIAEGAADALELLDNLVERDVRERLFPVVEGHARLLASSPALPWEGAPDEVERALKTLSESKDLLLRAAAVQARCQRGEDCASEYPDLIAGESTMNIMERVLFLESVDIFRQNSLDDLTALAAIAKEKTFADGEFILREGEPGDALYIITSGKAHIVKKDRRLLTLAEKASLGGVSLLDQKPHAASAVAAGECHTLVIDRSDFMDLVADRVELLHGIFLALTDRLRALLAVSEEGGLSGETYSDGPTNPV